MAAITEKFGRPTLAPLRKMTDADCELFLCSLIIDKKIARCVMLFSLNRRVFPLTRIVGVLLRGWDGLKEGIIRRTVLQGRWIYCKK
jgi:hypothetical protein